MELGWDVALELSNITLRQFHCALKGKTPSRADICSSEMLNKERIDMTVAAGRHGEIGDQANIYHVEFVNAYDGPNDSSNEDENQIKQTPTQSGDIGSENLPKVSGIKGIEGGSQHMPRGGVPRTPVAEAQGSPTRTTIGQKSPPLKESTALNRRLEGQGEQEATTVPIDPYTDLHINQYQAMGQGGGPGDGPSIGMSARSPSNRGSAEITDVQKTKTKTHIDMQRWEGKEGEHQPYHCRKVRIEDDEDSELPTPIVIRHWRQEQEVEEIRDKCSGKQIVEEGSNDGTLPSLNDNKAPIKQEEASASARPKKNAKRKEKKQKRMELEAERVEHLMATQAAAATNDERAPPANSNRDGIWADPWQPGPSVSTESSTCYTPPSYGVTVESAHPQEQVKPQKSGTDDHGNSAILERRYTLPYLSTHKGRQNTSSRGWKWG
ncbi:hypothetical protein BKA70DRAFT_1223917 [Coprinopsis sp. MPI-PUGE-AT-0042]|nr:hypothetical protein BKA70DRAFT_1223917 [Coprinopsis sp. MPI-PUGE-AT-0042]